MKRISFNGGELSPGIAARPDLDVYHRGASVLENVDVSQTGGVSRRHGMKRVFAALEGSILLPYVYSTNDRFLVEVAPSLLRVLSVEGDVVASLPSVWTAADVSALRHKQVNSMLFLACPTHELMVLRRDDEGAFSLAPYEFKARPWRYEEFRDFPVRLTLDEGCYRVSFGEHASDADAAVNEGDVMRVQVTVPQQTGFSTGAVIRQGWVIAKSFTAASSYAAGKKLCINEGSYWSWWTCDRDFNGAEDFVDGLTSPADYPEHFHKGVICHSNTITCKGTWKFWCNKEWYGTYAVERRFPNEDWQLLGSSTSMVDAASNLQITGDESEEECYLRLMLYESRLSSGSDPSQGFPPDSCGNKLVVDAYKKDVVLRLRSGARPASVQRFSVPATPALRHFLTCTASSIQASRVWVDEEEVPGASAVLTLGSNGIDVTPRGMPADALEDGQTVRFAWTEPRKSGAVTLDARGMRTDFWPAGARFDVNVTGNALSGMGEGAVVRLTAWSAGDAQFTTVWKSSTEVYAAPSSGFYTIKVVHDKGSTLEAAECQAEFSGVASGVVKPDVLEEMSAAGLSTSDVRKLTLPLGSDFCDFFEKKGLPFFSALLVDGAKVDGGFEVSREGRTLTVKPDGLTTDDVGAGSMVRLEWEQAEVSLDRFAEGSIEMYRFFLPAGTVVSMQGFVCVYAGQTIRLNSTLNVCSFCEGNGGSYSLRSVFSTMEKASFTVLEDGVYVVRMETWTGGSVSQRARAQLEVPACTAWMEAEVHALCMQSVTRALELVAQPLTQSQKSMLGASTGLFAKMACFMSSEVLNKVGMIVSHVSSGNWGQALALYGMMSVAEQTVIALWHALLDDEDEWEKNGGWFGAMLGAPVAMIGGVPMLGAAVEFGYKQATGQRIYAGTASGVIDYSAIYRAAKNTWKAVTGEKEMTFADWAELILLDAKAAAYVAGAGAGSRSKAADSVASWLLSVAGVANLSKPGFKLAE